MISLAASPEAGEVITFSLIDVSSLHMLDELVLRLKHLTTIFPVTLSHLNYNKCYSINRSLSPSVSKVKVVP